MKYIYVKKKDETLKYNELQNEPLLSIHILNIEVEDNFELPKGEKLTFTLTKKLTSKELKEKKLIKSNTLGEFIVEVSEENSIKIKHNKEIKEELKELDKLIPRALEAVLNILSTENTFDDKIINILNRKTELREGLDD